MHWIGCAGLLSLGLLVGCADGVQGVTLAACGDVNPCGGDIVGTWAYAKSCQEYTVSPPTRCGGWESPSGGRGIASGWDDAIEGRITFAPDHTYVQTSSEHITTTTKFPLDCARFSSCQAIADHETEDLASQGFPDQTWTCTGDASCTCELHWARQASSHGNWSVKGDALMKDSELYFFCVRQDQLTWVFRDSYQSAEGDITSGSARVLTRMP